MPNWCNTTIWLTVPEKGIEELKKFEELLDKWTSYKYEENDFGLDWLGNIVGNSGIGTIDTGADTDLPCRGSLLSTDTNIYKDGDAVLSLQTETAWEPMLDMWVKLRDKYLPDAEITYAATEPGCGLYLTNDPSYKDKYIIDPYDFDSLDYDEELSEKDLVQTLQEALQTEETDINTLIDEADEKGISVNQWEWDNEF